jgi:hypothetical protein
VYANRRRIRGSRGRRLMRQRGERLERSFAHLYDTGGMLRTHLRGHTNILKRLLIHAGGFNLGLVMRHLFGIGTPRGLQDRPATVMAALLALLGATGRWLVAISAWHPLIAPVRWLPSPITTTGNSSPATTYTTAAKQQMRNEAPRRQAKNAQALTTARARRMRPLRAILGV